MTLTAAQQSRSPLRNQAAFSAPLKGLPQSRDPGEVVPGQSDKHGATVAQDKAAAKPWAHLLGGGYVSFLISRRSF